MVARLGVTMLFGGLLQAMGMWAMASRWIRATMLYGGLGLVYWITLLVMGKTPEGLLRVNAGGVRTGLCGGLCGLVRHDEKAGDLAVD